MDIDSLLQGEQAQRIVDRQIAVIHNQWDRVCDEAALSEVDRRLLWQRDCQNFCV
jgi:serine/threonine-protein kinase HipA